MLLIFRNFFVSYIQTDSSKQPHLIDARNVSITKLYCTCQPPNITSRISQKSLIQISSRKPTVLKFLCSVPQAKCRDRNSYQATTTSFQVFSTSLPITPPTLRRHIFLATESAQGRGSSVSIVTRYGPEGPGIESRWRRDFPHPTRPVLRPTQPPIQWVPGLFTRGKAAGAWR